MNKELRKAIYSRSRLKNNFNKNKTKENNTKYRKQRNKCVNLRRKAIRDHFNNVMENGIITNKTFWKTVKPFITNKSGTGNKKIMIVRNDKIITDDSELVEVFNNEYINIVEKCSGIKPDHLNNKRLASRLTVINNIKEKFKNHPSIVEIKNSHPSDKNDDLFYFKEVSESEVSKLFSDIKVGVASGEDKITAKMVKLSKPYLIKPITNAINSSIRLSVFPDGAKRAILSPLEKRRKR